MKSKTKSVHDRVAEALMDTTKEMNAKRMTSEQAADEVRRRVPKQDILECFKDPNLDEADAQALKDMLKIFYNAQLPSD
jgi:hypothetical protein